MTVFRHLEINGGQVVRDSSYLLSIPTIAAGYTNSQIDDYGLAENGRSHYKWHSNTTLLLSARFSHDKNELKGTAGFGFWNAPFGDPTIKTPSIPKAVWFFFGSPPNHLPFFRNPSGNGLIAGTIHGTRWPALRWVPFTPFVLALNNISAVHERLWPKVQTDLGIFSTQLENDLTQWHDYKLFWGKDDCQFWVDDALILRSPVSPTGPLGFVCWVDNQYLIATGNGRFGWGTIPLKSKQTLEINNLKITQN